MINTKSVRLFVVAMLAIFIAGCASNGRVIEQRDVEKIKVGATTKAEMFAMFGKPLSQSYNSDGKLTMIWFYFYTGFGGIGMKQQNMAVLFDGNERVEKFNLVDNAPGVRIGP